MCVSKLSGSGKALVTLKASRWADTRPYPVGSREPTGATRLTRERHDANRTCARTPHGLHAAGARVRAAAKQSHTPADITQEPRIVLKHIYSSSLVPLRPLVVALAFAAMALAGSAGSNWG
jgi:hypothetical protein